MSNRFDCDDHERLMAFLYEEAPPGERAEITRHLSGCARCAAEVASLRDVRTTLAAWQPPEADLGFRIVRDAVTLAPRRRWPAQVWAPMALAAGLLLAVAASVEVEYGDGTLTLRTGRAAAEVASAARTPREAASALSTAPSAAVSEPPVTDARLQASLDALENRLRAEVAAARAQPPEVRAAAGAPVDRADLLRQVGQLIEASERRQQRELALRLAQVVQDVDAQRRTDMVRIENGLGQIEGLTGQEVARQRQLINYLMRTSQQR